MSKLKIIDLFAGIGGISHLSRKEVFIVPMMVLFRLCS
jgi:site-specific DNA-cytosine methylase